MEAEPNHHRGAATDLQAEALVPGPVDLSHLGGIVVPGEADARQLYGVLRRRDLGLTGFASSWRRDSSTRTPFRITCASVVR